MNEKVVKKSAVLKYLGSHLTMIENLKLNTPLDSMWMEFLAKADKSSM